MAKIETVMYLHSNKESNWEKADELGLGEEAARYFRYALCEVKFGVEVDTETGEAKILTVDGLRLEDREPVAEADAAEAFAQACERQKREREGK